MSSAVSPSLDELLPPLDVHAHVDPTVTEQQLSTLGSAFVFAVTRSLAEAERVSTRDDPRLVWGVGVHPGVLASLEEYDPQQFRRLLERFMFVGEIGLDRRVSGPRSAEILHDMLEAARSARRLCSLHSTGRQAAVVEAIGDAAGGMILHWFTGSTRLVQRAADAGAFFSVNAGMNDAQLRSLPPDRILPETDFPFTRKGGSSRPGDIEALERRVAPLVGKTRDELRQLWYQNLRAAFMASGRIEDAPRDLRTALLSA